MRKIFIRLSLSLFFLVAISACQTASLSSLESQPAVSPTPPAADSVERKTSEPYAGDLSIFEEVERENNLQINRVMDILKISEGKTVADIGAGSGWFTVRAARRVGVKGKVFAVEINQEYINHINERAKKENLSIVSTILGKTDDPLLPKQSVDAVLILKTYHEIEEPVRFLKNLRLGLRKDALVGIIDRNGSGEDHGIDKETVIKEATRAGFDLKEEFDFVKPDNMDYFLVFRIEK